MSLSKAESNFINARIAGRHGADAPKHMLYVPAHLVNGEFKSQRCNFSAYCNNARKKDGAKKDGAFDFVGWGKLADSMCRHFSVGRAVSLFTVPSPWLKGDVDAQGNAVMGTNGKQKMTNTVNFNVQTMILHQEGAEVIEADIASGGRAADWDRRGTEGYVIFRNTIAPQRNAAMPDYTSMTFVNARIYIPQGAGIQLADPDTKAPIAMPVGAPAGNTAGVMAAAGTVLPTPPAGFMYNPQGTLVPVAAAPAPAPTPALPAPPAGYEYNAAGQIVKSAAPAPAGAAAGVY